MTVTLCLLQFCSAAFSELGARRTCGLHKQASFYTKSFGLNRHDGVNNMHGWFQKIFRSGKTKSTQHDKSTHAENPVVSTSSASALSSSTSKSLRTNCFKPQRLNDALNSELRWRRKYDVFVCHSSDPTDMEEAKRLVLFLEETPRSLRCFLWQRDTCPGGAIPTEFCQAVKDSHIRALLITPSFVQDHWCIYMMHQALSEGPMSNRMIPMLQNLSHSQYPQELKFCYYIDLSKNPDQGFSMVNKTVHMLLEKLVQNEIELSSLLDGSSCGLGGRGSSQESKVVSEHNPDGTPFPLEVIHKRDLSIWNSCDRS